MRCQSVAASVSTTRRIHVATRGVGTTARTSAARLVVASTVTGDAGSLTFDPAISADSRRASASQAKKASISASSKMPAR